LPIFLEDPAVIGSALLAMEASGLQRAGELREALSRDAAQALGLSAA
jgi:hypothetical protein